MTTSREAARPRTELNFGGYPDSMIVTITLRSGQTIEKTWRQVVISNSLRSREIEDIAESFDKGEKASLGGGVTIEKKASGREAGFRSFHIPRHSYLPKNEPTLKRYTDGVPEGLEIWTWEYNGSPYGAAWAGRADKPIWHYRFRSPEQLRKQIDDQIRSYNAQVEAKRKRLEEKKNFSHNLKVGDILYSSWGYDQTNVDWYQVTKLIGKQVEIREIAGKVVSEGRGQDQVVALPDKFIGPPMKKLPRGVGSGESARPSIKLDSSQYAYPWDGRPKYQTSSGFGH